jgi:hypothetical protein
MAQNADLGAGGFDLERRVHVDSRVAADRLQVDVPQVAQVEKIIVDQLVRRVVMKNVAPEFVARVSVDRVVRRRVGRPRALLGRHPDPQYLVLFDQRVGLHACFRRHLVLPGHFKAGAARREQEAVVAAAYADILDRTAGKRQRLVATAVFQGGDLAGAGAEQHNVVVQQRTGQRLVLQFPGKAGDIPLIEREHF